MMRSCFYLSLMLIPGLSNCGQKYVKTHFKPTSEPSFQVDYAMPTADKPQSKLWFMNDSWWAILPRSSGPSLWQRTEKGWKEHTEVTATLRGVPGRADVWADGNEVTAVGVNDHSLTIFHLFLKSSVPKIHWETKVLSEIFPPGVKDSFETATIAKDCAGVFWISAVANARVCIWSSPDNGQKWSTPIVLAEGIDKDDISVITPLPDGVGVIWSDQVGDAVLMRTHKDGYPADIWEDEEVIEKGNKTADDHLNTSLATDGTLWLTTKNSVDIVGKPQFVLRIRSTDGKWKNKPYQILEKLKRPSRPIVVATMDNSLVFAGHGDNDRSVSFPHNSQIIFGIVDTALTTILYNRKAVISPDPAYNSYVQNVTGPRHPFPLNTPWIILASDREGRVYEADLHKLLLLKKNDKFLPRLND